MEFRWKPEEIAAPELNNDFKWRFASDMLKPKMQIEGPSVGSLLYAINPQTSELGLKQMDSELNQQLAANEQFEKRGDAAMKFMEQRVAEDIAAKQFADKMALEQFKAHNVDAGHFNSLMANLRDAYANNLPTIPMLEQQARQTIPNADSFINEAKQNAAKETAQNNLAAQLAQEIPGVNEMWENPTEKNNFIKKIKDSDLSEKIKADLTKQARSVTDKYNYRQDLIYKSGLSNSNSRALAKQNAQDFNKRVDEIMKTTGKNKTMAQQQARDEGY